MSTPDLGSQDVAPRGVTPPGYQIAKCTFKNGTFAGYLASSTNAYVWLTNDPSKAANVKWKIDSSGQWWLEKDTQPNDRFLGVGDNGYADWGLWQARPNGYIEPVIYNPDRTIALAKDASQVLYGPYGDRWVCFGSTPGGNELVVELVDAA
jgi:hypothetical protein